MKFGYRAASAALALACALGAGPANAATYNGLYTFCQVSGCADGETPNTTLLMDAAGNFYGTASGGGDQNAGVVFEFVKSGKKWRYKRLYSFCAQDSCADGAHPQGRLIMDTAGILYGTTVYGGSFNHGSVYALTPNTSGKKWKLKALHDFCSSGSCDEGDQPAAGLTYAGAATGTFYDGISPLYGTATMGGTRDGGTAFELTHSGKKWTATELYGFCQDTGSGCADGGTPSAPLLVDGSGNLFGTNTEYGAHGSGVLFELSVSGGKWSETVLHAFCAESQCADGGEPSGGALVMDASGNLYGTAATGGAGNGGTLFKLMPNGKSSKLTVLYGFCAQANCADGQGPMGDIVLDPSGAVIGATEMGGANGAGEIYSFAKTLSIVHAFCFGCGEGTEPVTGPTPDGTGNLFGVTVAGGVGGDDGAFYELTP